MNASRIRVGLGVGFLGLALATGTAAAQVCTASDCATQEEEVTTPTTAGAQLGTGVTAPPGGETGGEIGGETGGLPGKGDTKPDELGESETVGGGAQAAPEGNLPFTGGDVAGLVLIGGAAIGAGALLLRRTKTAAA